MFNRDFVTVITGASRYVGCASAMCGGKKHYACAMWPARKEGEQPYKAGKKCSGCAADQCVAEDDPHRWQKNGGDTAYLCKGEDQSAVREAAAKAKKEAEAKAKREADAKAKAEAKAKREAEAKAKLEAEAKAKLEAEAEAKAKLEAEAKAKLEAEAKAKSAQNANCALKTGMCMGGSYETLAAKKLAQECAVECVKKMKEQGKSEVCCQHAEGRCRYYPDGNFAPLVGSEGAAAMCSSQGQMPVEVSSV